MTSTKLNKRSGADPDTTDNCNPDAHTSIADAAHAYIKTGFGIIPVAHGEKKPIWDKWPSRVIRTADQLGTTFDGPPSNIGIVWGLTSDGVVDVDLDTDEAVRAAPALLPATRCFGRQSRPYSHWIYRSPGCSSATYIDPSDGKTLAELRGDRRQTIAPPSIHPSGEIVRWEESSDHPVELDSAKLSKLVAELAVVALIARHWKRGSRHTLALAIAGGLLRAGWLRGDVERLVRAIGSAAQDEEVDDRVTGIADAERALVEGGHVTGWPTASQIIGEAVVSAARKWLGIDTRPPQPASAAGTQCEILLQLADDVELFHDPQGLPFARLAVDGHFENHPIKARGTLVDELLLKFEEKQGQPPKREYIDSVIAVLAARARRGPEYPLSMRVAMENGEIVIDPGWNDWQVIKIGSDGFRIAMDTSVRFIRPRNLGALPIPQAGGALNDLRPFVNVTTDRDFRLLIMFLLASLRGASTYPILVFTGEPGSAKTTASGYSKQLCDPARAVPLRSIPKTERDIAVAARGSHVPAFTNISALTKNQSDTICRISTGEGFGIRQLYTDDQEFLFDGARPFILNGIEDIVTRSDLQDRAIIIELANITKDKRRPLDELDAAFDEARPRIFGALLDALSAGVRNINSTTLSEHPRMADVVRWAVACSTGTPWSGDELLADYTAMQDDSAIVTVESDDVGHSIIHWARMFAVNEPFIGTATELLTQLNIHTDESVRKRREWPSNPQRLVSVLKRLAPSLRKAGVSYERHRSGKQGTKTITVKYTLLDDAPRPEGVGGSTVEPEPCPTCGTLKNLWWNIEHGIWICTCTMQPKDPINATWLRRVTFIPDDPADDRFA